MAHRDGWLQQDGERLGVRARNREPEGGAELTFMVDPADPVDSVKAVDNDDFKRAVRSKVIDYKVFSEKVDQFIRELVVCQLETCSASSRIEREIERRVEVACKGSQGAIDRLVAVEIDRQVRAAVAEAVSRLTLDINVNGSTGKEAKDG